LVHATTGDKDVVNCGIRNPTFESMKQDVFQAVRLLRKTPGISFVAVFSLALGIGAHSVIFSLMDALFFRPFPVDKPDELVVLKSLSQQTDVLGDLSVPDFNDFRASQSILTDLAGHARMAFSVSASAGTTTDRVLGDVVSGNYFHLLGVKLRFGRGFIPEEDRPEARPVAVISYQLWRRAFGPGSEVLGKVVQINGKHFTIIGVAPEGFRGILPGGRPDVWIPLLRMADIMPPWFREGGFLDRRDARNLHVLGRLKQGVGTEQAATELRLRARQLEQAYPDSNRGWTVLVLPTSFERIPQQQRETATSFLVLLFTVVALVLLIACSNSANLMLLRTFARSREIAVRYALGATRSHIVLQLLAENLILYGAGFLVSIPLAAVGLQMFETLPLFSLEAGFFDLRYDSRTISFATVLAFVLAGVFGTALAVRGSAVGLQSALHERPGPVGRGLARSRLRELLVSFQVALAVVLLLGAGLFLRTLANFYRVDPGFRIHDVLLFSVDFNSMPTVYDEGRAKSFYREALESVRDLPTVEAASWAGDVPLGALELILLFTPKEQPPKSETDWIQVNCNIVTPGYVRTLGIPLVRGRDLTADDDEDAPNVVMINAVMAHRYWPGEDPIGREFAVSGRGGLKTVKIVGMVSDIKQRSLSGDPQPYIYFPVSQRYFPWMTLHVRVTGKVQSTLQAVKERLAKLDPSVPAFNIRTLEDQLGTAVSNQRIGSVLLGLSGVIALALASIGVYAVTAYSISQRTQEIGLRTALGAGRWEVTTLVMRQTMGSVIIGLAMGVASSLALSRYVESFLFDVRRVDFLTYIASTVILCTVAFLAAYIAARRAAEIDPLAALRCE
jgi:putative ABC transport system permease protein